MSKPEFWWCLRLGEDCFLPSFARETKEEVLMEFREIYGRAPRRVAHESVARIRVVEVPVKKVKHANPKS